MWQSHDHERIWCKTATSLLIPQRRVFARNLFYKIDQNPPTSFLWAGKSNTHLIYIKYTLYKLWGRGRTPSVGVTSFQRQHLHGESWSSKNKADHSSAQWIVSSLLFSRWKYCCTQSAYLKSSLQTEVEIQGLCNERSISSVMFFMFNILKWAYHYKAGEGTGMSRCVIRMSVQWSPADVVNYILTAM
jgi:hypothetical protein